MIDNRKGFWRAKLPRFHTNLIIFAIFKSSLNLNPIRHWSENWCPDYLEHALCSSEIHLAAAKSLEIIGHVTNCCKRPIAILRRQYHIILTASWEKIYSVLGGVAKRRSPIRSIFSPNAVNIMWYCRLKIAISFVSRSIICKDK